MNIFMFSQVKYASYEESCFVHDLTASIQLKGWQNLQNQVHVHFVVQNYINL
jgi:hypothetical protein